MRPLLLLCASLPLLGLPAAGQVTVRFDPSRPDVGPFPTDFLTTFDGNQLTNRRVALPLPADCSSDPARCRDIAFLNELDGFSPAPRIRVRFSGPVDVGTLAGGVFFVWADPVVTGRFSLGEEGRVTAVNQGLYDPQTNTFYAKPDESFDQQRRYLIVVTDSVRDAAGRPVQADPGFEGCLAQRLGGEYCVELSRAVNRHSGLFAGRRIVGGALLTTMSVTSFLEGAREEVRNSFTYGPFPGRLGRINVADVASLAVEQQVRTTGERFRSQQFPLELLAGVGGIAYVERQVPSFFPSAVPVLPSQPTRRPVSTSNRTETLGIVVLLPATPPPPSGYPVVIAGHGLNGSQFDVPFALAGMLARRGYAVVGINAFGHGYGPESRAVVTLRNGTSFQVPTPGRGIDFDGDGEYAASEGCVVLLGPVPPIALRDCLRQTATDLMQVVRELRQGGDVDGDGRRDVNPDRISYVGVSLGALYGTLFSAVEPDVPVSVLNVGGGTVMDIVQLSATLRPLATLYLLSRGSGLLNRERDFDSNFVPRYQPVRVNMVPGAIQIQEVLDSLEWLQASGDPAFYAPHLRQATLPGVPVKRVLFQIAVGDQIIPNLASNRLVLAANLQNCTSLYRHDRVVQGVQGVGFGDAHSFLADLLNPRMVPIALAAQGQVADFLSDDRFRDQNCVPGVSLQLPGVPGPLFEVPTFLP